MINVLIEIHDADVKAIFSSNEIFLENIHKAIFQKNEFKNRIMFLRNLKNKILNYSKSESKISISFADLYCYFGVFEGENDEKISHISNELTKKIDAKINYNESRDFSITEIKIETGKDESEIFSAIVDVCYSSKPNDIYSISVGSTDFIQLIRLFHTKSTKSERSFTVDDSVKTKFNTITLEKIIKFLENHMKQRG